MSKERDKTVISLPRTYRYGNYIFNIRREFAVGGHTILSQTVTMLLDEMEKRKEKQSNGNARE